MSGTKKGAGAQPSPSKPQPAPASGATAFVESSYYENLLKLRDTDLPRFELSTSDAAKTALEFYLRAKEKASG